MSFVTKIAHFLHGFLSAISLIVSPVIPPLMFVQFLSYELVEKMVKHDKAYPEICEWSIGFTIGVTIMLAKRLLILH